MNTGGGWIVEEGKAERMHRARRKHGVNGGRGEGRRAGGEQAGRRQEDRRKEENVGGMAESRREKKSVSLRRGKGKEEYGKGGFGGKTGERASDRASERTRAFGKTLHGEGG